MPVISNCLHQFDSSLSGSSVRGILQSRALADGFIATWEAPPTPDQQTRIKTRVLENPQASLSPGLMISIDRVTHTRDTV